MHLAVGSPLHRKQQVPTSTLPVLGYHAGESFRGIAPVCLDRALRALGIAAFDGGDDRLVLLHGRGKGVEENVHIEPYIALDLRLERVMKRLQAGTGDAVDEPAMKPLVELEDAGG